VDAVNADLPAIRARERVRVGVGLGDGALRRDDDAVRRDRDRALREGRVPARVQGDLRRGVVPDADAIRRVDLDPRTRSDTEGNTVGVGDIAVQPVQVADSPARLDV